MLCYMSVYSIRDIARYSIMGMRLGIMREGIPAPERPPTPSKAILSAQVSAVRDMSHMQFNNR